MLYCIITVEFYNMTHEYQLDKYFGCVFDFADSELVFAALKANKKFAALAEVGGEVKIGKTLLVTNANSDIAEKATIGIIAVDDMTFSGDPVADPTTAFMREDPVLQGKIEKKYNAGVNLATDIYDALVAAGIDAGKLYCGWETVLSTWEPSSASTSASTASSSSESPKTVVPAGRGRGRGRGKK